MKRTQISTIISNCTVNNGEAGWMASAVPQVMVCDPLVYSRDPSHAEVADLVGIGFAKDGTEVVGGAYVKVVVKGETKFVMPNMVCCLANEHLSHSASFTEAAKTRKVEADKASAEKDSKLAVLVETFALAGVEAKVVNGKIVLTLDAANILASVLFPSAEQAAS